MSNGEEDSDCGEDDEVWEEEGGYLVISADKVFLTFSRGHIYRPFKTKANPNHI